MAVTLKNVEESILPLVSKPNRYLGNYIGARRRDHKNAKAKMVLAFPDCFDLGMSHLGIKILYRIVNERDDALAELVFAPWPDMEEQLRRYGLPLFSLETRTPLSEFDVIGFSLQYELHYPTVLNMLDLGGVPILSEARDESSPLVLAGGPCAFAPEPMAPFIDIFLVGDGEEAIGTILDNVALWKNGLVDRRGLLRALAKIQGVYVPSLYACVPNSAGHLVPKPKDGLPGPVKPARIRKLSKGSSQPAQLVPLTDVTHSRLSVEVMRGCPRACRFCMPGAIYHPVRRKPHADVIAELKSGMAGGGWDEVSLLSLSTSDYGGVTGLVQDVSKLFLGRGVNVSLPSMRPGTLPPQLAKTLTYVRKSGLTFAPEAGTERLRRAINKDISDEEMIESVKIAATAGWSSVKLYFMIGLPTEAEEDLRAIAHLVARLREAARTASRRMGIKVSVAGFVPKPHTPFQWEAQLGLEDMSSRVTLLNRLMRSRGTRMRWRDPETTFLEGLLSRGDRKMADAVRSAWRRGCRFDGWSDQFRFDKWKEALDESGIDAASYLGARDVSEPQPWSHIEAHASQEFLLRERERAYAGVASGHREVPELRRGAAASAGIGRGGTDLQEAFSGNLERRPEQEAASGEGPGGAKIDTAEGLTPSGEPGTQAWSEEAVGPSGQPVSLFGRARRKGRGGASRTSRCFRVRYAKLDTVRFISHLDVIRAFDRALRKALLPVAFTQGFSKHPKIAFGPPLAVGMTSAAEYMDVEFSVPQGVGFSEALDSCLPDGLSVLEVEPHGEAKPDSLMKSISSATYVVSFSSYLLSEIEKNGSAGTLAEALGRADGRLRSLAQERPDGVREGGDEPWRSVVLEGAVKAEGKSGSLVLRVRLNVKNAPKLREVTKELLSPISFDSRLLTVERTGLWIDSGGELLNPFEVLTTRRWIRGLRPVAGPGVNSNS